MTISGFKINKLQIAIFVLLIIGLASGLFLVARKQIFKPKASLDLSSTFNVTDEIGNKVNCSGTTCTTYSNTVNIKFNQDQLENLKNSLP